MFFTEFITWGNGMYNVKWLKEEKLRYKILVAVTQLQK